ncbi:MAG: AsnC family transcriptional regulator [Candidatus Lokiarchaeota archaeon]|nr:AsnC family transcriptional regulator [Candidatus Lokiarchaeota archaeon]
MIYSEIMHNKRNVGILMKKESMVDLIDMHILEHLRRDSKKTYVEISEELGLSEATIRLRINKLKEKNIIKKFTIIRNDPNSLKTIIFLSINPSAIEKTLDILKKIKEIESIYKISGEFNIMAIGNYENFEGFRSFIWSKINTLEGLKNMKSSIIMKKYKENLVPKIIDI